MMWFILNDALFLPIIESYSKFDKRKWDHNPPPLYWLLINSQNRQLPYSIMFNFAG